MFLTNLMLSRKLFHNAADVVSISRLSSITVLYLLGTSDVVDADRSVLEVVYQLKNLLYKLVPRLLCSTLKVTTIIIY